VAAGFVLYRTAHFALSAEALTISRITVSGNARMPRGEVLSLLEGLRGAHMVTADLETWRLKLLDAPWVADAALRRVLPGTLAVTVKEREPMGIGRIGASLYLVDAEGAIIDEFGPNYAEFDLPIIDGLAAPPRTDGALIDDARAALAGRLLADLGRRPDLIGQVSQIDVTDVRSASVMLDGDTTQLRIGDDSFADRIQSYLDLRPVLLEQVPVIEYVDLRFDERVYVRPQASAARPQSPSPRPRAPGRPAQSRGPRASGPGSQKRTGG
jgi:cell division septal protein FtsQ